VVGAEMKAKAKKCHGCKLVQVARRRREDNALVFDLEFAECDGNAVEESQYCLACWDWARARYAFEDRRGVGHAPE
jgi:hypothetical protein